LPSGGSPGHIRQSTLFHPARTSPFPLRAKSPFPFFLFALIGLPSLRRIIQHIFLPVPLPGQASASSRARFFLIISFSHFLPTQAVFLSVPVPLTFTLSPKTCFLAVPSPAAGHPPTRFFSSLDPSFYRLFFSRPSDENLRRQDSPYFHV